MMVVIDGYTRQCLANHVARGIRVGMDFAHVRARGTGRQLHESPLALLKRVIRVSGRFGSRMPARIGRTLARAPNILAIAPFDGI
jgi:hypothetical protein